MEAKITVGLRCALVETGGQCVMTFGRIKMLVLHAGSLDSQILVSNHE